MYGENNMEKEKILEFREAMKIENLDKIKKLIESTPDLLYAISPFGTLLHDSARNGKYNVTKYLIEKGANVNAEDGKNIPMTPIVSATLSGKLCIVELLYKSGAKFDVDNARNNVLFCSIAEGYNDIAKFSIDHGIDITAKYDIGEIENCDAMEYARQYGRLEIYNYLKEKLGK